MARIHITLLTVLALALSLAGPALAQESDLDFSDILYSEEGSSGDRLPAREPDADEDSSPAGTTEDDRLPADDRLPSDGGDTGVSLPSDEEPVRRSSSSSGTDRFDELDFSDLLNPPYEEERQQPSMRQDRARTDQAGASDGERSEADRRKRYDDFPEDFRMLPEDDLFRREQRDRTQADRRRGSLDFGRPSTRRAKPAPDGDDFEWELVDSLNQDGPREAREKLAKTIFGSGVGFVEEDIRDGSPEDMRALMEFLDETARRERFSKNLEWTIGKLERKKKYLSQLSLGELYQERVKGIGDGQNDKEDYEVTVAFISFLKERISRSRNPRSRQALRNMLMDVQRLVAVAGPAYKVDLSEEDVLNQSTLSRKFDHDLDKGAFQFSATYIMGLVLDRRRLDDAMSGRFSRRPQRRRGSGGRGDGFDYGQQWDPFAQAPRRRGADGRDQYGRRRRGPGAPGGRDERGRRLDPNGRRAAAQTLDTALRIWEQDRRNDADRRKRQDELGLRNGPGAPGDGGRTQEVMGLLARVDRHLDRIRDRQREAIRGIAQYRRTRDPVGKARIEQGVRRIVYGSDPARPQSGTILGMLDDPNFRRDMATLRNARNIDSPSVASAVSRIFAQGGKYDRIQRTQRETIAKFLTEADRRRDRRRPGDDRDPRDPRGPRDRGPQAPGDTDGGRNRDFAGGRNDDGVRLPGDDANRDRAQTPRDRIAQIDRALQDPNLTPGERDQLQQERDRLRQQLARQGDDPASQAGRQGPGAPSNAASTASAPAKTRAQIQAEVQAQFASVPNTYGVSPATMSDGEIRGMLDGLIAAELAKKNAELAKKGLVMNDRMQITGKSGSANISAVGSPDFDKYREWMRKVPSLKSAVDKAAADKMKAEVDRRVQAQEAAAAAREGGPTAITSPR